MSKFWVVVLLDGAFSVGGKTGAWGGGGGDPQLRDLLITRVTSSPTSNAAFEAVWEDEFLDHT